MLDEIWKMGSGESLGGCSSVEGPYLEEEVVRDSD